MNALNKAIKHFGTKSAFAKKLDVDPMTVRQWEVRGLPPKRARQIEIATNGLVTREELLPEVFGLIDGPIIKKLGDNCGA